MSSEIEGKEVEVSSELIEEFRECFNEFDKDQNGHISIDELPAILKACRAEVPGYKLREALEEFDKDKSGVIEFDEFIEMVKKLSSRFQGSQFRQFLSKKHGVEHSGGTSESSAEGTTHSFSEAETVAFADWINSSLKDDPELGKYLPIDSSSNSKDLFEKGKDGILLCKMINLSSPGTIDMRAVNKPPLKVFTIHENQTLVINSAMSIGCNLVNIGAEDLANGKIHLVLGLLWQVIRIGLFSKITLTNVPGLARLLREGETVDDLHKLSPEGLLLRWVNYHLQKAGSSRQIQNFSDDITDSEAYSILLHQISPKSTLVDSPQSYFGIADHSKKAEKMLRNAEKINCRRFVRAKDVVSGNQKLNLAFVANLFNTFPNLPPLDEEEKAEGLDGEDIKEESREELTYRNWINSLGVNPFVTWLYTDFHDGLVLFQLYDKIKYEVVDWNRVCNKEHCEKQMGGKMKKIANCNYAVELGLSKDMNFSLVGIDGSDIHQGNDILTLALVWQMMRAFTYSVLSRLAPEGSPALKDADIVEWVNKTLNGKKKTNTITSFKDPTICTSLAVIDLVECISPKIVNSALVTPGDTDEDKLLNARYALSLARKIGATIYALPEDLVEVKPKMVLTVFACLMACALKKEEDKKKKGKK